jgi:hypothetical protein
MFENADVIYSYTAEDMMEDGDLHDVTKMAHEAGFPPALKVRITNSVHSVCTPPKSNKIQSYEGRLWDVLYLATMAIRRAAATETMITFVVKIGKKNVKMWGMLDTTSGNAVHIMLPEDY